jgi:hypothetical protein
MSGWAIAGIIAGALILLSFVPLSIVVRSEAGRTDMWLWVGFLRFRLTGRPEKAKKPSKRRKKPKEEPTEEKPDRASALRRYVQSLDDVKELVSLLKRLLRRALRTVRISKLRLTVTVATDNAASTALWYGRANIAAGTLLPFLYQHLRIRGDRIRILTDFQRDKPDFTLHTRITTTHAALMLMTVYAAYAILKFYLPRRQRAADANAS